MIKNYNVINTKISYQIIINIFVLPQVLTIFSLLNSKKINQLY